MCCGAVVWETVAMGWVGRAAVVLLLLEGRTGSHCRPLHALRACVRFVRRKQMEPYLVVDPDMREEGEIPR